MKRAISIYIIVCFLVTGQIGICPVYSQDFVLPAPGKMVALSPAFSPAVLKGIKLDPKNPFKFHFFVDTGDDPSLRGVIASEAKVLMPDTRSSSQSLKEQSTKLIKYFLASLTIPEKDLWVNLSPYEKNRIVPQEFGQTEMGRDLLAEDYLLKQITASLIYPESQLGKEFWQKVYAQAEAKYGTTNIPINTFNKVWIVPDKAVVYENGGTAFVLENHLKVMLEQDYLALSKNTSLRGAEGDAAISERTTTNDINALGSQIVREIVIPALTKEVNEGKNFAQLRQVFYSLILATWYKKKIKDSILNKIYSNRNKISNLSSPNASGPQAGHSQELAISERTTNDVETIYQQYLQAFKKGVYNYIKEESDPMTNQIIPRKYFSGGVNAYQISQAMIAIGPNQVNAAQTADLAQRSVIDVTADLDLYENPLTQDQIIERGTIALRSMGHGDLVVIKSSFNELVIWMTLILESPAQEHIDKNLKKIWKDICDKQHELFDAIEDAETKADIHTVNAGLKKLKENVEILYSLEKKLQQLNDSKKLGDEDRKMTGRRIAMVLNTINDIIGLLESRIEFANGNKPRTVVSINDIIAKIEKPLTGVTFQNNLSPTGKSDQIVGDLLLASSAIYNIAQNSLFFAQKRMGKKADVVTKIYQEGGELKIEISDNGGGIPDSLMTKEEVFDPLTGKMQEIRRLFKLNVSDRKKDDPKATGLGTTEAWYVIRDMGGDITVENGQEGAIFTISLPILAQNPVDETKEYPFLKIPITGGIEGQRLRIREILKGMGPAIPPTSLKRFVITRFSEPGVQARVNQKEIQLDIKLFHSPDSNDVLPKVIMQAIKNVPADLAMASPVIGETNIPDHTALFLLFREGGFKPRSIRSILKKLMKAGYVTNGFYVNPKFKGLDEKSRTYFDGLYPSQTGAVESILTQGREQTINLLAQEHSARFTRMAINYYYIAKYVSEQLVGVKFELELNEFINEAFIAGHEALSSFYYNSSEGGVMSSYIVGSINHKLDSYLKKQIWPFLSVNEIEDLLRGVKRIIEAPVSNLTDQFVLSNNYVDDEISKNNSEVYILIDEIRQKIPLNGITSLSPIDQTSRNAENLVLNEKINSALRTLSPREEMVIKLRFGSEDGNESTLEEVSQVFQVTRERIRQIETKAKRKLRHPSRLRQFEAFRNKAEEPKISISEQDILQHFEEEESQISRLPIKRKEIMRQQPLTMEEESELLNLISSPERGNAPSGRFTTFQKSILPLVLQHFTPKEIAEKRKCSVPLAEEEIPRILGTVRYLLTLGILDQFGTPEQIINELIRLTGETPLERLFRQMGADDLLAISGGDINSIIELIMQLYPNLYNEQDIRELAENHFVELTSKIKLKHGGGTTRTASSREVLDVMHHVANVLFTQITSQRSEGRRKMVLRRMIRDQYYQIIKNDPKEALRVLKEEISNSDKDPQWEALLTDAYNYYEQATAFQPRGFQEETEFGHEPLLPAQRFGIWEGVQDLSNPEYESVLQMSQARIGKTMMSLLSVYNVRDRKTGEYAVKRVLYTTTNQAKFETAKEFKRRTNKELDLQIIVVDQSNGQKDQRRAEIQRAIELAKDKTKNIVLIANYEAVRDFPKEMALFAPDAHIIDEVENLRGGDDTKRAPIIFGIPAKYRVGISARSVVNRKEDVVDLLLWARHNTFMPPGKSKKDAREELENLSAEELFEALDPIKVRWRRAVVMPEVKDPIEHKEYIPFSPEQEKIILQIQSEEFRAWRLAEAKPEKAIDVDGFFSRYQSEKQVSIDPGLYLPEKFPRELMETSSKIHRLDEIIDAELKTNGKVVIFVDFVDEVERLKARYNERYGKGSAFGIHKDIPVKARHDNIWKFRSEENPKILIGTPDTIGSSLNLFQIPGSSFHIATVVRLSRPWVNVDDGDRLVGIGQDHQVNVITLISRFSDETLAHGPRRTVEEMTEEMLKKKKRIFSSIVDGKPVVDEETQKNLRALAEGIQKGELPPVDESEKNLDEIEQSTGSTEIASEIDDNNEAMIVDDPGGIDLNPAQMNMQIKKDGEDFKFDFNGTIIDAAQVTGVTFTIRTMTPVTNLPIVLGLNQNLK